MDTYSSSSSRARFAAVASVASSAREVSGPLTELPAALGSREIRVSALRSTAAGSAPTARSSGAAVPPSWLTSAASRCSGSTCGLPSVVARRTAPDTASWLLRVSLSSMVAFWILSDPVRC